MVGGSIEKEKDGSDEVSKHSLKVQEGEHKREYGQKIRKGWWIIPKSVGGEFQMLKNWVELKETGVLEKRW